MKFDFTLPPLQLDLKIRQPTTFTFLSIVAIILYFGVSYHEGFQSHGFESSLAITSQNFQRSLIACVGGSFALLFTTLVDCIGKYLCTDKIDSKHVTEFLFILTILLPAFTLVINTSDSAVSFFWPLFHIQIVIILNLALLFWARKMCLSRSSFVVLFTSFVQSATFTIHVFVPESSWQYMDGLSATSILYMILYGSSFLSVQFCVRKTYHKNTKQGKDAVVLLDTAAAEQQWALCIIVAVLVFFIAFVALECAYHVDRFHLSSAYLSGNYFLLSALSLVLLTLHKRKELYHGVISQVNTLPLLSSHYIHNNTVNILIIQNLHHFTRRRHSKSSVYSSATSRTRSAPR